MGERSSAVGRRLYSLLSGFNRGVEAALKFVLCMQKTGWKTLNESQKHEIILKKRGMQKLAVFFLALVLLGEF
ncbi:hypothetical protein NECAME_14690 [Necator americanus]|uniref:Uncharacterized protein n=1 Tax=Necator americanus TaxID=51031 RepID=W2SLX5_NECAM|nr:hypothetical protein NECAME_14690 [Necator americanus]ETN70543.1 hypothetical protein NECAME_14690 [Necator americanus]